jgi:DNA-binding SARP family transcriptional activator
VLEIRLLGEQRVARAPDAAGRQPSSRALELLAHLVLHAGAPQARPRLAGVLWPESTEAQARTNLRRELHHLRALLDDDPSLVVRSTALLWCDAPSCRVDVRVFDTERAAALRAREARDRAGVLRHAQTAIAEYRGELMPGVYDDGVAEARDRLHRECVDLCDLAAGALRDAGDLRTATAVCRRRVSLEPLEETGYRALMELQAEAGDIGAAIGTYHRCATVLEQELAVAPGAGISKLVQQLLGRSAAPAAATPRIGAPGARLVGRVPEWGVLLGRWEAARGGEPGLVVASGEAGVGKTRLVAELAAVARAEGAVVATAHCFGLPGRLALAPVAEWLRANGLREAVAGLDRTWRSEVARLVPDGSPEPATESGAAGAPPGGSGPTGSRALVDAWQRHRFFEGLARAVLATDRPVLLVLDDLQWCDQETVAWLAFLLTLAGGSPLLVAATLRRDELDRNPGVAAALRSLRSSGRITDVGLGPLDAASTGRLASAVLGRPIGPAEEVLLQATTGGYPLFVVEAARTLPGRAHAPRPAPERNNPPDLRDVLSHRLQEASPAAQEVAGLASALGRDFGLDLLIEATELGPDALVGAVDELWRRRILREHHGGYDFSHDLLRDAAYAAVSPPRRWLLHRRLAQGLELLHEGHLDDVAGQLAEQHDRAGRTDRALHYFGRAAELAVGVFANADAIRHHQRCLALVARSPAGAARDDRELAVLQALSAPLNAVHGYASPDLQETLERSVALGERLDRPDVVLQSLVGLFAVRFVQGHNIEAHRIATRVLALAEPRADPALLGQAHFTFAGAATSLGRPAVAVEHFDLAERLSTGEASLLVGTRPEVHARAWAAHAQWLLGHEEEALSSALGAVTAARAADHPYSLAVALAYEAVTHEIRGDTEELLPAADELDALCRRYEFAYYGEWAIVLRGRVAGGDRGIALIEDGIRRLRSQGAHARMPYWLSLLARTHLDKGRGRNGGREAARAALDAARVGAERSGDRWWLPEVLRLRAGVEPGEGGASLLRRAVDLAAEQGSVILEARCRAALAETAAGPNGTNAGQIEANAGRTPRP